MDDTTRTTTTAQPEGEILKRGAGHDLAVAAISAGVTSGINQAAPLVKDAIVGLFSKEEPEPSKVILPPGYTADDE